MNSLYFSNGNISINITEAGQLSISMRITDSEDLGILIGHLQHMQKCMEAHDLIGHIYVMGDLPHLVQSIEFLSKQVDLLTLDNTVTKAPKPPRSKRTAFHPADPTDAEQRPDQYDPH